MRSLASRKSEVGETLVEVLVAVTILGLAGVAVMAGLGLAVKSSDIHRKETTGGTYVRTYAEDIQTYIASNPDKYSGCNPDYSGGAVGFLTPPGFSAPTIVVSSLNATGATVPCGQDVGIQLVQLSLSSLDQRATERLAFVLRQPCAKSGVYPCGP